MARYRVGDCYLSDAEYAQHQLEQWIIIIFVAGAVTGGGIMFHLTESGWPKWVRLVLIVISSLGLGALAVRFNALIAEIVQICVFSLFAYSICKFIWALL